VVDDSLTVRMDLRTALYGAGFRVTTCDTKAAALHALRGRAFAVVIIDLILPDGSGLDLIRELRTTAGGVHTPVMVLSTEAEAKQRLSGGNLGIDEFVGKPYDTGYVLRRASDLAGGIRRAKASAPPPTSSAAMSASSSLSASLSSGMGSGAVSSMGAGSGATSSMGASSGATSSMGASSGATSSSPGGKRVLIADGDPAIRRKLIDALRKEGHEAVTAGSGEEALALLAIDRVDAVILDFMLPGLGGLETCKRIRSESVQRFVPVMVVAGEADDPDAYRKALSAGADDLVIRQPDLLMVKVRLRVLFNRRREGRPSVPPSYAEDFGQAQSQGQSQGQEARDRPSNVPSTRPPPSQEGGSEVKDRPSKVPATRRSPSAEYGPPDRRDRKPPSIRPYVAAEPSDKERRAAEDADDRSSILPPAPPPSGSARDAREPRSGRRRGSEG
jgi:DNA-binding response OmpR family regulator